MNTTADATPSRGMPDGRFAGREVFQQMIRDALACSAREGWRELILSDASFDDWPLGEREVVESLQAWSAAGRRCTLLAWRYDELVRQHPRFVAWRKTWAHIVEARSCPAAADRMGLPSAIWSPAWVMQRIDPDRCAGFSSNEPKRRLLLREDLQAWLQKSASAFPATVLGL